MFVFLIIIYLVGIGVSAGIINAFFKDEDEFHGLAIGPFWPLILISIPFIIVCLFVYKFSYKLTSYIIHACKKYKKASKKH